MKNKLLSILLSLAIAFGLWLYVITVVDPESEGSYYDIPVVFDGVSQLDSRELMITSGTDVKVDLRLLGNRTDLNKLDKTNITILADLSRITEPGEHTVKYSISYPSSAGAIEVLEQDPQYITIHVSQRIRKEVPVHITYTGTLPDNFVADVQNAVLDHTTVTVSGPEEVVNNIEYAAVTVDLTNRMDTIVETTRHTLCDKDGKPIEDVSAVTVNVSDVRLTVRVWQIKELPLVIKVENGGGLTSDMVTLTPSHASIMVSGNRMDLEKLNELVLGTVNLGELTEYTRQLFFDVVLPEGVTNESGVTQVVVDVQMPEMETRAFRITEFQVEGVPGNLFVQITTQAISVKVRGPVGLISQLTPEMIIATVNCEDQELMKNSQNNLRVTITIVGMEGVGAVGEYAVRAYVGEIGPLPEG